MTVPVLWASHHDEILARGYADQGLVEAVLDHSLWRPPGALDFEHHEVRDDDWPRHDLAFVVVNGRTHRKPSDLRWLHDGITRQGATVFLISGVEEDDFPWWKYRESATRRVWIMQPRPHHAVLSGLVPGGWYPGTREGVSAGRSEGSAKPYDWAFGGQVTHQRRQDCAKVLRDLPNGWLYETDGYLRGIPQADYWAELANAKVVPCPSGPFSVDTARPLEALEAGCVPIVDLVKLEDPQFDYWRLTFGDDCPWRGVHDWAEFPELLAAELDAWPHNANRDVAFWCAWKRRIAYQLHDDLRAVGRLPLERATASDHITAIVTTSPAPRHPDTDHLGQVVASIRERLPTAEILVVCDGVRPEQQPRRTPYGEYVRRVIWRCQHEWHNVLPVVMESWGHQANAVRAALERVTTPLVLLAEHDTPLVGAIDFEALCPVVESGEANMVQFHENPGILAPHRGLFLDGSPRTVGGVPLLRTSAFYARPHLASARFYRERVLPRFPESSRTYTEDRMYGEVATACEDDSAAWWDWRLFVYAPDDGTGLGMRRSAHLDSRGADPKWPVRFE